MKHLRKGKIDRVFTPAPTLRASIRGSVSLSLFLFMIMLHVEDILVVASQLTMTPTFGGWLPKPRDGLLETMST